MAHSHREYRGAGTFTTGTDFSRRNRLAIVSLVAEVVKTGRARLGYWAAARTKYCRRFRLDAFATATKPYSSECIFVRIGDFMIPFRFRIPAGRNNAILALYRLKLNNFNGKLLNLIVVLFATTMRKLVCKRSTDL